MDDGGDSGQMPFDEKALGSAIQSARKSAGLTQQQLCEQLDISYSALTKIERGAIKAPSIFTVAQISRVCKVPIEALLGMSPILPDPSSSLVAPIPQTVFKKARNGIEFIYFDINGCMVRFFQRAFSELAHDTGASPELIEDTFWHYNDAVCRGEMPMSEFNSALAARIGADTLDWQSYYMRNVDPIMEMQDCVKWVSENYRVGLLSNIMPGFIDQMIARGLLPNLPYTAIIDSSVSGAIKPEPRIYELAAEKSGVAAQDILLIDDSRTNLMAAARMGWHVMWFDDFRPEDSVGRIRSTLEF
jgi:FMN phosphatase YigB (HAD superfamily)/DNA-binding XRE family transcriptional regulator